jgi:hypothetical protein
MAIMPEEADAVNTYVFDTTAAFSIFASLLFTGRFVIEYYVI